MKTGDKAQTMLAVENTLNRLHCCYDNFENHNAKVGVDRQWKLVCDEAVDAIPGLRE
jgi:hypothetical protein